MKLQSRRMALCGMTAALGVVLMILGALLELGMYVCPMFVGLCLIPIGNRWGVKYQLVLWAAIGLLCLMLVSNLEQNLMFLGFFGWYPALRPRLQRLPALPRLLVKLALFNAIVIAIEALLVLVVAPEIMGAALTAVLLILGNITFLLYDFAIPRFEWLAAKHLKKLF